MGMSEKVVWKVYMGVIGAVTTIAAQKLVRAAWKVATGNEPPSSLTDPDTPMAEAVSWALASGVGVGVTQLLTTRFAAKRWSTSMGHSAPGIPGMKVKIKSS